MKMLSICHLALLIFPIFILHSSKGVPVGVIPHIAPLQGDLFLKNLRILVWVAKSLAASWHQSYVPLALFARHVHRSPPLLIF